MKPEDAKLRSPLLLVICVACLLLSTAFGQQRQDRESWTSRMEQDFSNGVASITQWYDIPVSLVFLARSYYKADNPATKLVNLPPLIIDREIAGDLGVAGQESPGSVDPWIISNSIAVARLLYSAGGNMLGAGDMEDEYAHAWTYYRALMYNHLLTELFKNTISRERPDASDTKSFFSGHTSTAFVTSAFLFRECAALIDEWQPAGESALLRTGLKASAFAVFYGWAGYVGYSRLADKKHYVSDVLVGALAGTLIGNLVYEGYFGAENYLPDIGVATLDGQPALSLTFSF